MQRLDREDESHNVARLTQDGWTTWLWFGRRQRGTQRKKIKLNNEGYGRRGDGSSIARSPLTPSPSQLEGEGRPAPSTTFFLLFFFGALFATCQAEMRHLLLMSTL